MSTKNVTKKSQAQLITKSKSDDIKSKLMSWAHEGTKESIEKLREFINKERDEDLRGFAEIALSEASDIYYSPDNDLEENDFLLAKMILRRKYYIEGISDRIEAGEFRIKRFKIDKEVHNNLMKKSDIPKDWKYRLSPDYYSLCIGRLEEFKDDVAYEKAWVEIAKKLIKTDKYKTIPEDVLLSIHFDWEDDNFPFENEEE